MLKNAYNISSALGAACWIPYILARCDHTLLLLASQECNQWWAS
jgi:hypothetical protein